MTPGTYTLTPYTKSQDERLSVWMAPSSLDNVYVESDGARKDYVFHIRFNYVKNMDWIFDIRMNNGLPQYELTQYEPDIFVFENHSAEGSAYFIPELNYGTLPDFKSVKLVSNSDTKLDLAYSGSERGWVVLPMRNYPGWQALLNGQPVDTVAFLKTLPAIPVSGPVQITYQYRPWTFYIACWISLFSLLLTLFFIWRYHREINYSDTLL